jgi:hypothetical protein
MAAPFQLCIPESSRVLCYDRQLVGQSVLEWSTHLGLTTRSLLLLDSCGLLMWGALSDERTGLSFTIAVSPRQGSHSRVRDPWDSRPYFTVLDSRLPLPSPPTTRGATVEASTPPPHGTVYSCSSCPTYNPSARTTVENTVSNGKSTVARELLSREPVCLRSYPRHECCFKAVR